MRRPACALAFALLAAPVAAAGDMAAEIRSDKVDYFLSAAFARYGPDPRRTVAPDKAGVRFKLARLPKDQSNVGVYSHFALGGDFEVAVDYEVVGMPAPTTGYGMQVGVAVHTHGPTGAVFLQRENHPTEKQCWMVTRETPKLDSADGKDYDTQSFPASAAKGRLVLRRQGAELALLAGEKGAPPAELKRVPLGVGPVYQVRLFADTGGADLPLDARFTNLSIRADTITGLAMPPSTGWPWTSWLLLGSVVLLLAYAVLFVRRRRGRDRDGD